MTSFPPENRFTRWRHWDDIIFLQKLPLFQKTDDDGYEIKES